MAKIIFYELEDWEQEYIKEKLQGHELIFYEENLDKDNLDTAKEADALGIFIYSELTPEVMNAIPNLKLVVTMSTGYDHVDLNEAKNKNITVCNVPSYGENTVAEHTFALLLTISKKIFDSYDRAQKGDFSLEGLRGFDLKGKTIGVVGTGKIGRHVIKIAKGFEMNVIAFDPYPNEESAKEMDFRYVGLDELLSNSDIITLHAPYMESTHHMINKDNISKIKKGAVLINTARGGLVETDALIEALRQGIISSAGLDVLEEECFIREEKQLLSNLFQKKACDYKTILQDHMLIAHDDVIVTPHNAFNTKEALIRILDATIENIQKFFEGNAQNVVGKK